MDLNVAEISYETGEVKFRFARYLSPDGARWIRHGLFTEFHRNGQLASRGMYEDGLEDGSWQDFYENGQIAAEGTYYRGAEVGTRTVQKKSLKTEATVLLLSNALRRHVLPPLPQDRYGSIAETTFSVQS